MDQRTLRVLRRAMLPIAAGLAFAIPASAGAQVTSNVDDWNLTESVATWPTSYHISSTGDGWAAYRWLDTPSKTTVISGNACPDLALYGQDSIGVNDTAYHNLFQAGAGLCFVLRGRTASGSGSMVNHDGRIRR